MVNKVVFKGKANKYKSVLWLGLTDLYPCGMYDLSDSLVFEETTLKVPAKYKEILEFIYGDYMQLPPVEQRTGHGHDIIIDLEHNYTDHLND